MKPHLVIKLRDTQGVPRLAHWEEMITDRSGVQKSLTPEVDAILKQKYKVDFISSQNYKPKGQTWSSKELENGLNRVFRLIVLSNNPNIPASLIEEVRLLPNVSDAEKGKIITSKLPDQQLVGAQSLSSKYHDHAIYLKEAHRITKGHPDIKIAVLDTGIATDHREFATNFFAPKDFVNIIDGAQQFVGDYLNMDEIPDDLVGHGTHVAGIITAKGQKMPIGVAPQCTIVPVKVLGAMQNKGALVGAGLIDDIDAGIKYAVDQGVDVINMSLGIKHSGGGLPHKDVIQYALSNNVCVVAASGNDGTKDKYYPGAINGVLAVGASDSVGMIAPFSTFGGHVSVSAPGVNIYSAYLNNGYAMSSGTSQASPFVSGTIGLLKSYALTEGKTLSNATITSILQQTSDKFTTKFKDEKAGFGRINIYDALRMLRYNL